MERKTFTYMSILLYFCCCNWKFTIPRVTSAPHLDNPGVLHPADYGVKPPLHWVLHDIVVSCVCCWEALFSRAE